MDIAALINRFCERGYDVTLISETLGNNLLDFRCDHRLKRLSFNMGVRNCATRAELLTHFVSQLPESVYILTDFDNEAFLEYPAVIKARSGANKVICLSRFPFASLLDRGSLTHEQLIDIAGYADAFVSNFMYDHVIHNTRVRGKSVFIPYFYPYGAGEYRAVEPGGKSILLCGRNTELIAKAMEELAVFVKSDPGITLKVPAAMRKGRTAQMFRESAELLGLEDRMVYDESGSIDELAQDCAFALVISKFVYPSDMYVQLTARRLPVLFASSYCEPAFLTADLSVKDTLANMCGELMKVPGVAGYQAELSAEASERTFSMWKTLITDVLSDRAIPGDLSPGDSSLLASGAAESFTAHFDEILNTERPVRKKKRPIFTRRIREFIKKKIYYRERLRASKYVSMQMSPEQVRKSQLLASKMLVELERICKKHDLRYYVAAGSLLGAARHGGPIPWDDDVDVTMPRKDYEKFIQIAQDELPEDMILPQNNYPYGFHRIQIKGTAISRVILQKGPHGVFLDILPLDGAAPTEKRKRKHERRSKHLLFWMVESTKPQPLFMLKRKRLIMWTRRLLANWFAPKRLLSWAWKRNAVRYDTDTSLEWVCMPGLYGYEKECFPKEYWGEPARLMYEGREVPVMREWEKYLISHYRDYTMPPPILCRRTHYLFAIDFGRYESMSVQDIQKEVEEYRKNAQKS